MFSSTKTTFKKSSTKNAANFINDSNDFDNTDMKDKVDQFIVLNDKKNSKKSLIKINLDVKQNISKIKNEVNSKDKEFMSLLSRIVTKHFHKKNELIVLDFFFMILKITILI